MTNVKKGGPQTAPQARKIQAEFQGFISCDLKKSDKQDFLVWAADLGPAALLGHLESLVDDGYKLSWGEGKLGMSATLINNEGPETSRGWALSSQATQPVRALELLLYKHLVMLERDWPVGKGDDGDFFR